MVPQIQAEADRVITHRTGCASHPSPGQPSEQLRPNPKPWALRRSVAISGATGLDKGKCRVKCSIWIQEQTLKFPKTWGRFAPRGLAQTFLSSSPIIAPHLQPKAGQALVWAQVCCSQRKPSLPAPQTCKDPPSLPSPAHVVSKEAS